MSDITERRIKRTTIAAIVSVYGLAITWAIHPFFNWIFIGLVCYFGVLRFYFLRELAPPSFKTNFTNNASSPITESLKKRMGLLIGVTTILTMTLVAFIFSKKGIDETNLQEQQPELQNTNVIDPSDSRSLLETGTQFYESRQYDSALKYYNSIGSGDKDFKEALYNKSLVNYDQKKYPEAIRIIKQCIQQFADYADAKQMLGDCYSVQQKQDSALVYYQQAYQQGGRNPQLCHWLGYLYDVKENFDQAKPYYKEALGLDSSRVEIYERLATLQPADSVYYLSLAKRWREDK
jgi:tetratricopeptide (TPR) repeat protein